jgi:hypothetical protein
VCSSSCTGVTTCGVASQCAISYNFTFLYGFYTRSVALLDEVDESCHKYRTVSDTKGVTGVAKIVTCKGT